MALSQQQLQADWVYLDKVDRTLTLTDKYKAKVDAIPGVVNNLNSTSTTDALSAAMGRKIQDKLDELSSLGSFLSVWDASTWLPQTNPLSDPYVYAKWDYYIVGRLGTKNYKPFWSMYYAGVASTTLDVNPALATWDQYMYDWSNWTYVPSGWRVIVIDDDLSQTSTNPVENRRITEELWKKATTEQFTALSEAVDTKASATEVSQLRTDLNTKTSQATLTTALITNEAYWQAWDNIASKAPSAKAVYNVIKNMWGTVDEKADVTYWRNEPVDPKAWDIFVNSSTWELKIWDWEEWKTVADKGYVDTELWKKQNTIENLDTIISWAEAWATAIQPGASLAELDNSTTWFIDKNVNNLTNYTKTSDLWAAALSNNYSDLTWTPTIWNWTLTINMNGEQLATFNANSSDNVTVDITDKWDEIVYVTNEEYNALPETKYTDWKTYFIYI